MRKLLCLSGLAVFAFCVARVTLAEDSGPDIGQICPSWLSPDGSKAMYISYSRDPGGQLWVLDPDGSNPILLTGGEGMGRINISGADWSPDSRRIVYSAQSEPDPDRAGRTSFSLRIVEVATKEANPIDYTLPDDTGPKWSPDGSLILFTRFDWEIPEGSEGFNDIFVVGPDGTGLRNQTNHLARDSSPAWSPDGTQITFVSARDDDWGDIFVMDADGSNPVNLTPDEGKSQDVAPSWSPDGSQIVFGRLGEGVFVVNSDGTDMHRISENEEDVRDPACSSEWLSAVFDVTAVSRLSWGRIKSDCSR